MGKHLYAGVSLLMLGICAAAVIGFAVPAVGEVVMPVVTVGNAGNDADSNGRGSVADAFAMAKYEVTNTQYAVIYPISTSEALPNQVSTTSYQLSAHSTIIYYVRGWFYQIRQLPYHHPSWTIACLHSFR